MEVVHMQKLHGGTQKKMNKKSLMALIKPEIQNTDHPSVDCTKLPDFWRIKKSLGFRFKVFFHDNIANDGVKVKLSAGNHKNPSAQLKNNEAIIQNGIAEFIDLRFNSTSGRDTKFHVFIVLEKNPPLVVTYQNAIKVTVDGPRPKRNPKCAHSSQDNVPQQEDDEIINKKKRKTQLVIDEKIDIISVDVDENDEFDGKKIKHELVDIIDITNASDDDIALNSNNTSYEESILNMSSSGSSSKTSTNSSPTNLQLLAEAALTNDVSMHNYNYINQTLNLKRPIFTNNHDYHHQHQQQHIDLTTYSLFNNYCQFKNDYIGSALSPLYYNNNLYLNSMFNNQNNIDCAVYSPPVDLVNLSQILKWPLSILSYLPTNCHSYLSN